jgi:hypothetical protein
MLLNHAEWRSYSDQYSWPVVMRKTCITVTIQTCQNETWLQTRNTSCAEFAVTLVLPIKPWLQTLSGSSPRGRHNPFWFAWEYPSSLVPINWFEIIWRIGWCYCPSGYHRTTIWKLNGHNVSLSDRSNNWKGGLRGVGMRWDRAIMEDREDRDSESFYLDRVRPELYCDRQRRFWNRKHARGVPIYNCCSTMCSCSAKILII